MSATDSGRTFLAGITQKVRAYNPFLFRRLIFVAKRLCVELPATCYKFVAKWGSIETLKRGNQVEGV